MAEQCSLLLAGQPVVPLIFKLAAKNLFHDKLRFIATIVGIVFSIVLVTVQMGLFLSFERMVTTMIDHAPADLWIMPLGTKCFEDPSLLDERERFRAMAIKGVSDAVPILISFAQWRVPSGGTTPVLIIGSDPRTAGCTLGTFPKAALTHLQFPMRWRSTDPILSGLVPWASATLPKSAINARRCGWSLRVSARLRPRPMYSRCSIGRGPIRGRRRTRPPICCVHLAAGADVGKRSQPIERDACQSRGTDAGRISQPQPLVLAVRNRRRRRPHSPAPCSA